MPRVAEVLIGRGDGFVTEVTGEVMLQFGGFAGDRHFGLTRAADSRTPWHPRGTVIGNTRQISIVSIEVCAAAHDVGIARIYLSAGRQPGLQERRRFERHAAVDADLVSVGRHFVCHGRKCALPTAG